MSPVTSLLEFKRTRGTDDGDVVLADVGQGFRQLWAHGADARNVFGEILAAPAALS